MVAFCVGVVTTVAGQSDDCGTLDGSGTNARFCHPFDVAADSAGNLFVADNYYNTIRKISTEGDHTFFDLVRFRHNFISILYLGCLSRNRYYVCGRTKCVSIWLH